MINETEYRKQWAKIVAKAWVDEDYKHRLLDDPAAVLCAEGVEIPEGLAIKCVEASEKKTWLVLPPKPDANTMNSISEERIAAGTPTSWCLSTRSCI